MNRRKLLVSSSGIAALLASKGVLAVPMPPVIAGGNIGNSGYTPTHFASANANGGGSGSASSPWTLEEAMRNAVAGNRVQVEPGIYVGRGTVGRWASAFAPSNSGTSDNPIVFFAANRSGLSYVAGLTTEIRSGGTSGSNGSPAFGAPDRSYIIFDGFYTDNNANNNKSSRDTGPVNLNGSVGCEVRNCVIKGVENQVTGDNYCGVRLEVAADCIVSDCYISGFRSDGGSVSQNHAGVMSYDARNCVVANCEIVNCGCGIFWKGDHSGDGAPQYGLDTHHNIFRNNRWADVRFGGVSGDEQNRVFQNHFISDGTPSSGAVVFTSYVAGSPTNVWVANNTFVGHHKAILTQATTPLSNRIYNNIFYGVQHVYGSYSTSDVPTFLNAFSAINYNLYRGISNFSYTEGSGSMTQLTFTSWRSSYGMDQQGIIEQDPRLASVQAEDYSLLSGSPAQNAGLDVLNLLGFGTSSQINIGSDIGNGDVIGRRAS
ncbi:MAG: right-handed parallel beta-helix repeat-containing protein [Pseudomonadales bacterium]